MSARAAHPRLRRDTRHGLVGGVLAGIGNRTGIDPVILRVAFVAVAIATGGVGLLAYLVLWAALPDKAGARSDPLDGLARLSSSPGGWLVAAGVGLLTLSALLAFRQLGIWWSDQFVWPLVLAAFGAALLWRRSRARGEPPEPPERAWAASEAAGVPEPAATEAPESVASPGRSRFGDLYSGVFGVLLVIGAALLFLSSNNVLGGLRSAALTSVVVLVALGLIMAPFLWRLGRNLAAERAERIRSQDRAEVAAHLHDSVLQTLTLMQKRADDPREVAALARRQERELRDWLAGDGQAANAAGFAAALRAAAEQVEDDHRVAVEVVVVGDCELDEPTRALLGAAREALLNAAKYAPEPAPIRAFAEVDETGVQVFVRDRGPGFELAAVPGDRRGVRESIIGRMERAGGTAAVIALPGGGTEVALAVAREQTRGEGG